MAAAEPDRYLVIDATSTLRRSSQLGRDIVEATVWPMSEAEALLLGRSLRLSEQEPRWNRGGCWRS